MDGFVGTAHYATFTLISKLTMNALLIVVLGRVRWLFLSKVIKAKKNNVKRNERFNRFAGVNQRNDRVRIKLLGYYCLTGTGVSENRSNTLKTAERRPFRPQNGKERT